MIRWIKKYDWLIKRSHVGGRHIFMSPSRRHVSRHNGRRRITSCFSFRYKVKYKRIINNCSDTHEDLFHQKIHDSLGRHEFSGWNKSSCLPTKLGNKCIKCTVWTHWIVQWPFSMSRKLKASEALLLYPDKTLPKQSQQLDVSQNISTEDEKYPFITSMTVVHVTICGRNCWKSTARKYRGIFEELSPVK